MIKGVVMMIRTNKIILVTILVAMLIVIVSLNPAIYAQNYSLEIKETYTIEKDGGNLYMFYDVTIHGVTSGLPDKVEFKYPSDFIGDRFLYIKAFTDVKEKNLLKTTVARGDMETTVTVYTSGLEVSEGAASFKLIVFMPLAVYQEKPFEYAIDIIKYPATNIPIEKIILKIAPPLNTKPEEVPQGLEVSQISPAGVKPEQYEVKATFTQENITYTDEGLPEIYKVTLSNRDTPNNVILLLKGTEDISIKIYPDGEVRYTYVYTLKNYGYDALNTKSKLTIKKPKGTYQVDPLSLLDRELESEDAGTIIYVNPPYVVLENMTLQFKMIFYTKTNVTNTGLLGEELNYDILVKPTVDFLIEEARITVYAPDDTVVEETTVYNFTRFMDVRLDNTVKVNMFTSLYENEFIGIAIYFLIAAGGIISVYRAYYLLAYRRLPEEMKRYLKEMKQEIKLMEELINLEDKYLKRETKSKEYLKRRSQIIKALKKEMKKKEHMKSKLSKVAERNPRVREALNLIQDMEDKWKEMRRLEEDFLRRKITPDQYTEERRHLLTEFRAYLKKIEGLV